ncbi:MAG: division/cell wall cluster transcriptional repressor MraZ [Clostridiales bacterium]|jgi:MraZ protein|nr:division/cell wall cluster transcriptional repressor MraZ [Clostridiales bacterium]MDR2750397.1 division/cell wall cluster transcriptional repressor MraZ [Clostridiales bacterium]
MFRGEFFHTMDAKGRACMPAKFREGLGTSFILTKGLDGCLLVYAMPEWEKIEEQASKLPLTDKDARKFLRFFIGSASEAEPDSQARFNIPQSLRDYAGLEKDIVSLGLTNRIELWGKEKWDKYNSDSSDIDDALAEKMSQLGI